MRISAVLAVACATLLLGGCPWPRPVENLGCDAQFEQKGNWSIRGIEIPINHPLIGTVKIGSVEYTAADYAKISETIRILDQARLGYCSLTTAKHFPLLSVPTRDAIFLKAAKSYDAIVRFGVGLKEAKTPADGLSAQQEAAEVVPVVKFEPLSAFVDGEARLATADLDGKLKKLRTEFSTLSQNLEALRNNGAKRIQVTGFELNGSALAAEQRATILFEVGKAVAGVPLSRTPTLLLIGYADGTGIYSKNVDLALRRASNVAEFLRRHDFGRDIHMEVTSGGISQLSGDRARRVEVVVSLNAPVRSSA